MILKIMRGCPGSGKSTYVKSIVQNIYPIEPAICSADDFFIKDGKYEWNASLIGEAHKVCMRKFLTSIHNGWGHIIVDNTNIEPLDIAPYVAVGEAMGYDVEIIQLSTPLDIAAPRNVHGVPPERVKQMYDRMQKVILPRRWKVTKI